jgi:hypothetical protein
MSRVSVVPLPDDALLQRYADRGDCYTDAFCAKAAPGLAFSDYVQAFYTTPLFRTERLVLRFTVGRPSTDAHVTALAQGTTQHFAAWEVEDRRPDQLLLCDMGGRTRSWLMVRVAEDGTELYFGSAIVPHHKGAPLGVAFERLIGLHKLYSRALLSSAARQLRRQPRPLPPE